MGDPAFVPVAIILFPDMFRLKQSVPANGVTGGGFHVSPPSVLINIAGTPLGQTPDIIGFEPLIAIPNIGSSGNAIGENVVPESTDFHKAALPKADPQHRWSYQK